MKKRRISEIIYKLLKRIIKIAFYIFIIFLLIYSIIYNIYNFFTQKQYIRFGNITIHTYNDKSMYPDIKRNDLIIANKNDKYYINDIIVYEYNNQIKIQRINNISNIDGKVHFITKGDNNLYNNIEKIEDEKIIGKVENSIPILGIFAKVMQMKLIFLFIIISIVVQITYVIKKSKSKNNKIIK